MRAVLLLLLAAGCGGPMLANAPRANPAAVAGGAAAVAGAITLANPDAAGRKPEKKDPFAGKQGTNVKENVPPDVFDRLDHPVQPMTDPTPTDPSPRRKGPPPKIPSPQDAANHDFDQDR